MRVLWSAEALDELENIELHIAKYSIGAADRLSEAILRRAETLVDLPLRGRVVREFEETRLRESIVHGSRGLTE